MTNRDTNAGRPSESVIESEIAGDISLYHPPTEKVTVLNTSASDVWRLCDGNNTVSDIATMLANAYGIDDPAKIESDVAETVRSLRQAELLVEK